MNRTSKLVVLIVVAATLGVAAPVGPAEAGKVYKCRISANYRICVHGAGNRIDLVEVQRFRSLYALWGRFVIGTAWVSGTSVRLGRWVVAGRLKPGSSLPAHPNNHAVFDSSYSSRLPHLMPSAGASATNALCANFILPDGRPLIPASGLSSVCVRAPFSF